MEKLKSKEPLTTSLQKLDLNIHSQPKIHREMENRLIPTFRSLLLQFQKPKPPSLKSLCLGVIGTHFEDFLANLSHISHFFPSEVKLTLAAIARRRKILTDDVIIALVDSSWEILDISGSDVSDIGLSHAVKICKSIRAADISRCRNITPAGVYELLQHCSSLEILRWGGCPKGEYTARRSLSMLKPYLEIVDGESWEELHSSEISHGAPSLRWLVWPKIDKDSLESLSMECPRIIVNPEPSPFGYRGIQIPQGALEKVQLDDYVVEDIDVKTWAVSGLPPVQLDDYVVDVKTWAVSGLPPINMPSTAMGSDELTIAEKFRLAFEERDNRLAPKRAKNARQHQRRAEKEFLMMSTRAKAIALASRASKSLPRS